MKALLLTSMLACFTLVSLAQNADENPRHTIAAQFGVGWFGLLNSDEVELDFDPEDGQTTNDYTVEISGSPAASLTYDYRFGRVFSLGGAVGYQKLAFKNFNDLDANMPEPGDVDINRIFISARTLFHYGRNPKWDLYSGVRLGTTIWNVTSTVDINEFQFGPGGPTISSGSFPLPHLVPIPFGFKYYPNERLMIGSELALGSPHFFALQVGVTL